MGLNTLGVTFLLGLLVYFGVQTTTQEKHSIPELPGFLVPQSTGKERPIVSKTHDASMYTERARRTAILKNHSYCATDPRAIRESNITAGFSNGAVEAYMLTSICTFPSRRGFKEEVPVPCVETIYDGGSPFDNFTLILDGMDPMTEIMDVINSQLKHSAILNGGNPYTNLC
jgi:hypothetical protein